MPPKRKRPERSSTDGGRPSPHHPGDTPLAQHNREDGSGGGGGGRGRGRGGRGNFNRRDSSGGHGGRGGSNQSQHNSPTVQRTNSSSQAMPPPSPMAPPTPTQSQPAPAPAPRPSTADSTRPPSAPFSVEFRYDNLTDERLRSWTERGRNEVVQHGCQSRDDMDITELSNLFQEFVHAVIADRLEAKDAGTCVKEILGDEPTDKTDNFAFEPHCLLLDSLAIVLDIGEAQYRPSLRTFLQETGVSVSLVRQVLDAPILYQLGLIRDNFSKVGVKQATNLLYRQANYNLLREETEGYSKLITELYMTSDNLRPEVPQETFERIKALIGTFDLDVGRVLDVSLDVSAAVLVKQYKFFVKLLRVSSWWPRSGPKHASNQYVGGLPTWATPGYPQWTTTEEDEMRNAEARLARDITFWDRAREVHLAAFYELGGRRLLDSGAEEKSLTNGVDSSDPAESAERQWMEATKTLPPGGNRVAAHLLGFKLLFYYSGTRDRTDVLPANLLYLAALLIKIGFISLPDLYPHLSPNDDGMERVREKKLEEIEEAERKSRGGQMNALLMAGVLPQGEDDNPNATGAPRRGETAKKAEPEKKQDAAETSDNKQDEPHEQKVSLLIQLLTIGALPESLFILGRFPWIPEVFPEVLDCIHRVLHESLSKVYSDARAVTTKPTECPMKNIPDYDQTGLPKGNVRLTRMTTKKVLRWPTADKYDHNDTQDYRYYWDEWTDNVPVCQTVGDVFTLCDTFLNISGVNIGKDAALLTKLAIIGSRSLQEDTSDHNLTRWRELLKRLLLPALSHSKSNAATVNAVWNLLRRYPTTVRFALYAEWFEGQTSRLPAMKSAFARARAETRATMKRVSLTNLSEMAKRLAKTTLSSPGIVFTVAFEQLESYPNLIEAFVECAKYFTDMSYDVLVWSLLNSLGKSRSRTQAEHALTTSKWLQALSRFIGKVFRRYSVLTPVPVLNYVNDQLTQGNSTDLIILKEFITSMGGIVDAADFTDQQILGMAGGEYLRRQTLIRGQDKRFDNIKSSQRLIKSLTDTELASQILLNLAQYRQAALFQVEEDEAHIKFLSSIVDDSHQILIQYLDFIWSNLDPATFDKLVPSIPILVTQYGLDTSLAFSLGRASLSYRMFPWKAKEGAASKEKPAIDKDGDATMSDSKTPNGTTEVPSQEPSTPEVQKTDDPSLIRTTLNPIVESVQETMPPEVWQRITPELYVTFWALQLGDLFCPDKIYRQETNRLKTEEAAIARDRSDMSRRGQERKMEKRKELMQLQIDLSEECGEHMLRQGRWKFHLSKLFQTSFPEPRPSPESIADVLLEQCFLPRILVSPADAEYTYRFIKALHEWNAPGFKLMALCERLFNANRLRSLIFTSSLREVENVGRFLKLLLEDLSRWHKNDPVPGDKAAKDQPRLGCYDKEGKGSSDQPRLGFALTLDENGKPQTFVEHAQFQDMLFRWHKNLNTALKSCLGGTEWMHIRNAITVLKAILDYFPAIDFMATQFTNQLQSITKKEAASKTATEGEEGHRVDLSVAAQGAMSELQRRKSKWMMVQAFRPNSVGGAQKPNDKSDLRATAPEFKPQPPKAAANKASNAEAEDGEVGEVPEGAKQNPAEGKPDNSDRATAEPLPAKPTSFNRDTAKREGTPGALPQRASTPKANQGTPSGGYKGESRLNLPDRPPHNLPSRPDVPIPGHYSERYAHTQQRGHDRREPRDTRDPRGPRDPREAARDGRDTREHRDPREGWPADTEWNERPREYVDRRATDATRDANRTELMPRHGAHEKDRTHRDGRSGRPHEPAGDSAAPSHQQPAPASQEPAMNPERAALFRQDGQDWSTPRAHEPDSSNRGRRQQQPSTDPMTNVNPQRAALIGDNAADGTPTRPPRDDGRDRGMRTHSPRRGGRHAPDHTHPESGYDDRHTRPHLADPRAGGRNPRDRSPMPGPGGYRGERPMEDRGAPDKVRDPSAFYPSGPRGQEHDYRTSYEDQNYGRLNPIQTVGGDIPSGPRGRGRGASRGGHGGHGHTPSGPDNRYGPPSGPRPPSPERHPPTGPSGRNSGRRGGYEVPTGPSTPAAGPIHADRMKNLGGPDMSAPAPGVHPDRLAQLGGGGGSSHPSAPPPPPPPPGGPPSHGHGRHSMPSASTPDRPRADSRSGPNPNMAGTPTPEGGERGRAGGSRRQLAGINNMLQANKPDVSRSNSRRNQPRTMLGNSDVQVLTGGSPVSTPTQEQPSPMRFDSSTKGPANGDDTPRDEQHERSNRRERDDRSDRPSRSSRRSSRDRERSSGRDKDGKEHRDYRDRRSGAGTEGGNRDDRESRRSGRGSKDMGPPPTGRESTGGRERHRGDGSGPKGGDDWGAEGRGGRGPPKGGERREDRGRKRRSEEGVGGMTNEREKRQRR